MQSPCILPLYNVHTYMYMYMYITDSGTIATNTVYLKTFVTKNFRELHKSNFSQKNVLRIVYRARAHVGRNFGNWTNNNYLRKILSLFHQIREIRESILSRKFLGIRYTLCNYKNIQRPS